MDNKKNTPRIRKQRTCQNIVTYFLVPEELFCCDFSDNFCSQFTFLINVLHINDETLAYSHVIVMFCIINCKLLKHFHLDCNLSCQTAILMHISNSLITKHYFIDIICGNLILSCLITLCKAYLCIKHILQRCLLHEQIMIYQMSLVMKFLVVVAFCGTCSGMRVYA